MIVTKRGFNQPEYGDRADILKVSDNFNIDESNLDGICGGTWGGNISADTDTVENNKIYIDTRSNIQWLALETGEFSVVKKEQLNLSQARLDLISRTDGINGYEFGSLISQDTDFVATDLVYVDTRTGIQWLVTGEVGGSTFGTCEKKEWSLKAIAGSGEVLTVGDIVDNLTTASATKPLSANMGKTLKDDEWKINAKKIGNTTTTTDLNTILEPGFYRSSSASNIFTNLPNTSSGAFMMRVENIRDVSNTTAYGRQWLADYTTNREWVRTNTSATEGSPSWTPWGEIMTSSTPPIPVGALIFFETATNPATLYSDTTWSRVATNRNIRGALDGETGGLTGGSDTVTISQANLPNVNFISPDHTHTIPDHVHTIFGASGGNVDASYEIDKINIPGMNGDNLRVSMESSGGGGATSSLSLTVPSGGSGTALTVTNAFYKIHIWKRLT